MELKIVTIGSSRGVVIPKAILDYLNKKAGDTIKIEIKED